MLCGAGSGAGQGAEQGADAGAQGGHPHARSHPPHHPEQDALGLAQGLSAQHALPEDPRVMLRPQHGCCDFGANSCPGHRTPRPAEKELRAGYT